jgi:hypothetical protein
MFPFTAANYTVSPFEIIPVSDTQAGLASFKSYIPGPGTVALRYTRTDRLKEFPRTQVINSQSSFCMSNGVHSGAGADLPLVAGNLDHLAWKYVGENASRFPDTSSTFSALSTQYPASISEHVNMNFPLYADTEGVLEYASATTKAAPPPDPNALVADMAYKKLPTIVSENRSSASVVIDICFERTFFVACSPGYAGTGMARQECPERLPRDIYLMEASGYGASFAEALAGSVARSTNGAKGPKIHKESVFDHLAHGVETVVKDVASAGKFIIKEGVQGTEALAKLKGK